MTGFKTSLFGFSKKSVLSFTKELSDTYAENLKEKDKEISTLKAEIKEIKEITELKDKQIVSLTNEINELKQKLKETENGTDE